jgi:hypothetical protein
MGRLTDQDDREAMLAALQDECSEEDDLCLNTDGAAELSEAEQAAAAAQGPTLRGDGRPLGAVHQRQMTPQQQRFADLLIEGKPPKEAYRDAYNNTSAADSTVATAAYKLRRHPLVAKALQDAQEQTHDVLVEDTAAAKRYVLRSLVALSTEAKQEGSRLKALELLGRASGMWRDKPEAPAKQVTAAELKAQLQGHLRLVGNGKAVERVDVNAGQVEQVSDQVDGRTDA